MIKLVRIRKVLVVAYLSYPNVCYPNACYKNLGKPGSQVQHKKSLFVSDILNILSKMALPNARLSAASERYLVLRTSGCRTQKTLCVNKTDVAYSPSLV
jgi:hypothetical protein